MRDNQRNKVAIEVKRAPMAASEPSTPTSAATSPKVRPMSLLFDDDDHHDRTLHRLNTLRKEGHFCDATLEVAGHNVPVHRAVLASSSLYLFELFSAKDETRAHSRHVKLDHVDYASLEVLISYAYTSRLECDADMVKSVYRAATTLKIQRAADACSRYLADNLTPLNCLGTRAFANSCCDDELTSKANTYIQENLQAVLERSTELHRLPNILVDIVGPEPSDLSETAEKSLCKLVVDWLEVAADKRPIESLAENPHVLYLASDNCLRDCLEDVEDNVVNNSDIVRDYKKLGKRKQILPVKGGKEKSNGGRGSRSPTALNGNGMTSSYASQESLHSLAGGEWSVIATKMVGEKSFVCVAILNDCPSCVLIKFRAAATVTSSSNGEKTGSPSSSPTSTDGCRVPHSAGDKPRTLTPLGPMSSARCGLGTAVLNGRLVALGGYDRGECLSTVEAYDLHTNTWSPLKPMLTARGRFAVAQLGGRLYACGGSDGQAELKSVECYDPDTETWNSLPDMSIQRSSAGVATLDGRLYVVGGWSGYSGRAACEVFDPDVKEWTTIASLNTGRSQAAVCAVEGGLVAVGGCDAWNCTNSVELYEPLENRWTFLSPMSVARRGAGVAYFKNKLYVVGGSDGQTSLVTVEIYDLIHGSWSLGPSLGMPRANMGVAVMNGRLFAVGGFSGKAFLESIEYLCADATEWCGYRPANGAVNNGDYGKERDGGDVVVNSISGESDSETRSSITDRSPPRPSALSPNDSDVSDAGDCGLSEAVCGLVDVDKDVVVRPMSLLQQDGPSGDDVVS